MTTHLNVPGGEGRALRVAAGQHLQIRNVHGHQVCDFVAFDGKDPTEYLSTTHTRSMLGHLTLSVGDQLRSNLRNPMFELVADTVRQNDFMLAMCDSRHYELVFGLTGHRNCKTNVTEALAELITLQRDPPDPINWFQNTPVDEHGEWQMSRSPAQPGDYVTLLALVDAVVAVSACPQDQYPINDWVPTDIEVILESPTDSSTGPGR